MLCVICGVRMPPIEFCRDCFDHCAECCAMLGCACEWGAMGDADGEASDGR